MVCKLHHTVELIPHAVGVPTATEHSAGWTPATTDARCRSWTYLVPTGVKIALPVGHEAQIRPRSGLAAKTKRYGTQQSRNHRRRLPW
jgi:dUTPase